ncbi:major capsid protein [Sigmofec virus UA08Rod_4331]|uniref:Major capsid protein n=1 Tax=Sigmofec virus UA08Rod_4331 TaxID=2929399 RepID=A0A976N2I7_9VIRU|nr:major capsid protein [Sigmofec virus UA08Rod_4331]
MGNIFKSPMAVNRPPKNGHDLSQRNIFSCQPGQLLPCFNDFGYIGDKYRLNSSSFIRTEAVETSAFMRLKHHCDWFFVPIMQIYSFWNEFYNGTNDVHTDFVGTNPTNFSLPTLNIYNSIFPATTQSYYSVGMGDNEVYKCDNFGVPRLWNAYRLLDLLDYGCISRNVMFNLSSTGSESTLNVFPFLHCAYHKIFYSHYCNTKYFKNRYDLYNLDSFFGGKALPTMRSSDILSILHYRPYRYDYFTFVQPSPIYGIDYANYLNTFISSDSQLRVSNAIEGSQEANTVTQTNSFKYNNISGQFENTPSTLITSNADNDITLGSLRRAFALDKLARVTGSAKSHYVDQCLAHFGVKPPEGISNEAYFLGSQVTDININEVVATASTGASVGGSTLGDIAGKGLGYTTGSQDINFTCPCEGVIMAISSIEPLVDYSSARLDIINRYLQSTDFFHPELDNLGMVPLFDSFGIFNFTGAPLDYQPTNILQLIKGWVPQFTESKTKYDKVRESIFDTYRNSWAGYKQSVFENLPFAQLQTSSPSSDFYFYICPQYCNNIFLNQVPFYLNSSVGGLKWDVKYPLSTTPNLASNIRYAGDNFLINMEIKCFKVDSMSDFSLPKYI